jgi:putative oxidoreductase
MSTKQACGLTVLRIAVAVVFLMHGGQKLFVLGFHNVTGMMTYLHIPLPHISAIVVTLVEFFGGLMLLFGAGTRVAALLLAIDMAVAILKVHLKGGFFLPAGYEFALTLLLANIALLIGGGGSASVDGILAKRK